jgi:hypothetical protein
MVIFLQFKCYVVTWRDNSNNFMTMKINIHIPKCQLPRIYLAMLLTNSVLAVPIANRAPGPNLHILANGSGEEEQTISQFEWSHKETQVTKEGRRVLDHLIRGDSEGLLSSGAANLPDTFPATENLVPGQTDSATDQLQEVTGTSEDVGHTGHEANTKLMQVWSLYYRQ